MYEIPIGALALVLACVAAFVLLRRRRAGVRIDDEVKRSNSGEEETGTPGRVEDVAAMERSKLVIHAVLQSVTDNVNSLLGDSSAYGDSLERHKSAIGRAMTIAGIHELERVMLAELEQMQSANSSYRAQLDDANRRLHAQQEELERLQSDAGMDFLTRIPNRRALDRRMDEETNRARRYGTVFSLVVFDVDHFKRVNDTYGHLAGDRILRAVARLVDEDKRGSDFLARYGGEEFVILLPETNADQARLLAEKMRKKVEQTRFHYEKLTVGITVSAGVGEFDARNDTKKVFFARVDGALYQAKQGGRNRVAIAKQEERREGE